MSRTAFAIAKKPNASALDLAKEFIESHAFSSDQRNLLISLMDHFPAGEDSPYVEIPCLVFGGITESEDPAVPLAVLGSFLFLGLDIIDDIADGDVLDHWPEYSVSELHLAASLFLSSLPQSLIAELTTPEEIRTAIQKRFAKGLAQIAAGQQKEFMLRDKAVVLVSEVEKSVAGKTAGIPTLASLAALFAEADQDQIRVYEEMAKNFGVAAQLATDFYDLFQAPISRDLRNGTKTLPIALCLEKCSETEKKILFGPLQEARSLLFAKGIGRLTAFIIELYSERARKNLDLARPKKLYQEKLFSCISNLSLFKKEGSNGLSRHRKADR